MRETEARYAEASKAREQKKKADDLKKELAWSHVASKKNEMEEAIQHAAKLTRRLAKIEENVQSSEVSSFFSQHGLGIYVISVGRIQQSYRFGSGIGGRVSESRENRSLGSPEI